MFKLLYDDWKILSTKWLFAPFGFEISLVAGFGTFLMCFERNHFYAKIIVCSDDIYIKTIYLLSRTDVIHMLLNEMFSLKIDSYI